LRAGRADQAQRGVREENNDEYAQMSIHQCSLRW
jgi:hypothetical protein